MTDYPVTITETIATADYSSATGAFVDSISDSITTDDAQSPNLDWAVSLGDSIAASDALMGGWAVIVSDLTTMTDVQDAIRGSLRSIDETVASSDVYTLTGVISYFTLVEGIRTYDHWDAVSSAAPVFNPVYENINPVVMDLYVNDVLIVGGVLLLDRVYIVRDDYLGFVGDLAIIDTLGSEDPVGTPLRLPPSDLRNALQRALPLSLGGKLPPEGAPNKIPGLGKRWLLTYWPVRVTSDEPTGQYQIIPTTDSAAQRISVTLGGQSVRIDIYTKSLNVAFWNPGMIIT